MIVIASIALETETEALYNLNMDYDADISGLPNSKTTGTSAQITKHAKAGSTALCVESASEYMLGGDDIWHLIKTIPGDLKDLIDAGIIRMKELQEQTAGNASDAATSAQQAQSARDTVVNNYGGLKDKVTSLEQEVADLKYVEIAISVLSNDCPTNEMGSVITSISFSWSFNKTPTALSLDGESVDAGSTGLTKSVDVSTSRIFVLRATDEKGKTTSKTTSVVFLNGIYYGVATDRLNPDNTFVLSLTKILSDSMGRAVTLTAGAEEYYWYALPTRLGTPTFNVGGFYGGFHVVKTYDFQNASGYTEEYCIWRSDNAALGTQKIVIS